jgi:voltage-dependent calcium channel L type alpha-1D
MRIIKLVRQWKDLQDILRKTYLSLQAIIQFSLLLTLFLYICALLGMQMFSYYCRQDTNGELILDIVGAQKKSQTMLTPRANFDTISSACTTVFIIIIGEDWPAIAYNFVRSYGNNCEYISLYFIFVLVVGNFMLLSLFTAILLQNFEGDDFDQAQESE